LAGKINGNQGNLVRILLREKPAIQAIAICFIQSMVDSTDKRQCLNFDLLQPVINADYAVKNDFVAN
jgi:hypothetical protein